MVQRSLFVTFVRGLVLAPAAWTHHAFAASYDFTRPVTVTGKVKQGAMHRLADSELIENICEESNKFEEQIDSGGQP